MPNRSEWDDVQVRYKEALQTYLASKEKPADVDEAIKEIPVITISDDNDAVERWAETSTTAENVDDKNSVKKSEEEPIAIDDAAAVDVAVKEAADGDKEEAAVVVNPDSSNTDKALTDYQNPKNHKKQKFKFDFPLFPSSLALYRLDHFDLLSLSLPPSKFFITFFRSLTLHHYRISFFYHKIILKLTQGTILHHHSSSYTLKSLKTASSFIFA